MQDTLKLSISTSLVALLPLLVQARQKQIYFEAGEILVAYCDTAFDADERRQGTTTRRRLSTGFVGFGDDLPADALRRGEVPRSSRLASLCVPCRRTIDEQGRWGREGRDCGYDRQLHVCS